MLPAANLYANERISLRPVILGELPILAGWHLEPDFSRQMNSSPVFSYSEKDLRADIEDALKSDRHYMYGVHRRTDDTLVGYAQIEEIQWSNRVAWLALGIGGEHQNQGYGRETLQLIFKIAFHDLGLYRLQLTVFAYNQRAISLYEKMGFTHEGTFRQMLFKDGQRFDMYLYGILVHEWNPSH